MALDGPSKSSKTDRPRPAFIPPNEPAPMSEAHDPRVNQEHPQTPMSTLSATPRADLFDPNTPPQLRESLASKIVERVKQSRLAEITEKAPERMKVWVAEKAEQYHKLPAKHKIAIGLGLAGAGIGASMMGAGLVGLGFWGAGRGLAFVSAMKTTESLAKNAERRNHPRVAKILGSKWTQAGVGAAMAFGVPKSVSMLNESYGLTDKVGHFLGKVGEHLGIGSSQAAEVVNNGLTAEQLLERAGGIDGVNAISPEVPGGDLDPNLADFQHGPMVLPDPGTLDMDAANQAAGLHPPIAPEPGTLDLDEAARAANKLPHVEAQHVDFESSDRPYIPDSPQGEAIINAGSTDYIPKSPLGEALPAQPAAAGLSHIEPQTSANYDLPRDNPSPVFNTPNGAVSSDITGMKAPLGAPDVAHAADLSTNVPGNLSGVIPQAPVILPDAGTLDLTPDHPVPAVESQGPYRFAPGPDAGISPAEVSPTPSAPHFKLDTVTVQPRDNLTKILTASLSHDSSFAALDPAAQTNAVENLTHSLRGMTPDQLKELGFKSGNIDKIFPKDVLHLEHLNPQVAGVVEHAQNLTPEHINNIANYHPPVSETASVPHDAISATPLDSTNLYPEGGSPPFQLANDTQLDSWLGSKHSGLGFGSWMDRLRNGALFGGSVTDSPAWQSLKGVAAADVINASPDKAWNAYYHLTKNQFGALQNALKAFAANTNLDPAKTSVGNVIRAGIASTR